MKAAVLITLLVALASLANPGVSTSGETATRPTTFFIQTNLVSDRGRAARFHDRRLVNAWGIAAGPSSPMWVTDTGTGFCTIYDGRGRVQRLAVSIPPKSGSSAKGSPTAIVYNGRSTDFDGDAFIFATEDGTISGWSQSAGTNAVLRSDNSAAGADYDGLAIGTSGSDQFIYAANYHSRTVDAFDSNYQPGLAGSFIDPDLPAGYAPYGIQNINGDIFVAYALDDGFGSPALGAGNGIVNIFATDGSFVRRFASNGVLDAPWGMTVAPAGFGPLSNQILIGNLGDGAINGFDPVTGQLTAQLIGRNGKPIHVDGLWALQFGNGSNRTDPKTLYFAAGPAGYLHGLFGQFVVRVLKKK